MTRARSSSMAGVRIGISGWTCKPWRGAFYREGFRDALALRRQLGQA